MRQWQYSLDGAPWVRVSRNDSCSSIREQVGGALTNITDSAVLCFRNLSVGAHKVEVAAVDLAGNVDPAPRSLSWETTPVSELLKFATKPDVVTHITDARFKMVGLDYANFRWRLDGGGWQRSFSDRLVLPGMRQGVLHVFEAQPLSPYKLRVKDILRFSWYETIPACLKC